MYPYFCHQVRNIDKDIPIGTPILKVKATDADSGLNADIEYHMFDHRFTINAQGIVSNTKRLVSYVL